MARTYRRPAPLITQEMIAEGMKKAHRERAEAFRQGLRALRRGISRLFSRRDDGHSAGIPQAS